MAIDSNLERAFKRITNSWATNQRPILQCIKIENGTAFATDSHRALMFKEYSQDKTLQMLLNLKTFTVDDEGNYPDIRRLMKVDGNVSFEINNLQAEQIQAFCKMAVKLNSDREVIDINISGHQLNISTHERKDDLTKTNIELQVSNAAFLEQYNEEESFELSCDATYLMQALEYFTGIKGAWHDQLLVRMDLPLRPFMISNSNTEYLLTPVRTF